MASKQAAELAAELIQLRQRFEEVTEACETWRANCLRAQAEVRALKRQSKFSSTGSVLSPGNTIRSFDGEAPSSPRNGPSDVQGALLQSELRDSLQSERLIVTELREELGSQKRALEASRQEQQQQHQRLLREQQRPTSGSDLDLMEVDDLRQQVKQKNNAIMQLQADMMRDNQQIDRKRREAENTGALYREELNEMTQRAKEYYDQVNRSRKKVGEYQAARDEASKQHIEVDRKKVGEYQAARDQVSKLHLEVEDCESRLAAQSSQNSALQQQCTEVTGLRTALSGLTTEADAARAERQALQDAISTSKDELSAAKERSLTKGDEHLFLESRLELFRNEASEAVEQRERTISSLEEATAATPPVSRVVSLRGALGQDKVASAQPQKGVVPIISSLRQMCAELQKELQTDVRLSPRPMEKMAAKTSTSRSSRPSIGSTTSARASEGGGAGVKAARLAKQLEQLQKLVVDAQNPALTSRAIPRTKRAQSPEGEHPPPEDDSSLIRKFSADANETMQQEVNGYRLAAEKAREDMLSEHCEELDDLVSGFSQERQTLHNEIRDMRAECARAEVAGAAAKPMSEIRAHFESQVATMKRELVAQLSDVHDRECEQRGVDDRELEQLKQNLEQCQQDLTSSQEEFLCLSTLYDKERREHQCLKSSQRAFEVVGTANTAITAAATMPAPVVQRMHSPAPDMPRPQAIIATTGVASGSSLPSFDMIHAAPDKTHGTPDTTGTWDSQTAVVHGFLQGLHTAEKLPNAVVVESPVAMSPPNGTPIVGGASASATATVIATATASVTPPAPVFSSASAVLASPTLASPTTSFGQRSRTDGGRTATSMSGAMPQMRGASSATSPLPGSAAASALAVGTPLRIPAHFPHVTGPAHSAGTI